MVLISLLELLEWKFRVETQWRKPN